MANKNPAFVKSMDIDTLIAATHPSEVAAYYGVAWPAGASGKETKLDCPVSDCEPGSYGKLSVNLAAPYRIQCFSCGVRGNLLTLMWIHKHQKPPAGGKLRGDEFKEMLADLKAIRGGAEPVKATAATENAPLPHPTAKEKPLPNIPLKESDNERVRALVTLDEHGTLDESVMKPEAASYRRKRPWLTDDLCRKWHITYLPSDAKGTLRGRWIYRIDSVRGEALAWVGRDPEFEAKAAKWQKTSKGTEPVKHRFPSADYFRRGLELYGQAASRLDEPGYREKLKATGILLVEGMNDVLRLDALKQPALGVMSNRITDEQIEKLVQFAKVQGVAKVSVMFDRNDQGQEGSRDAIARIAKHLPVVDAWGPAETGPREPEGLSPEEWRIIEASLSTRWGNDERVPIANRDQ